MIPDHELIEIATKNRVDVAGLDSASKVLHQLIGIQDVIPDLAAERVLHTLAAQSIDFFGALSLVELV